MAQKVSNIYHLTLKSRNGLTFGPGGRGTLAPGMRPEKTECMENPLLRALSSEEGGYGGERSGSGGHIIR